MSVENALYLLCRVSYDGTNYCGWQRQPHHLSIQQVIEESLAHIYNAPITIFGAGRTDSGVHAVGQHFHTVVTRKIPEKRLLYALNSLLPDDIVIHQCWEVEPDFHARFKATMRSYRYTFYSDYTPDPFCRKYAYWIKPPFNWDEVEKGCSYFEGQHDFSAFRSAQCTGRRVFLTMNECQMIRDEKFVYFDIRARSFLHNMIRIMMGTLWEVGKGKRSPDSILEAFENKDRKTTGKTLSPHGLKFMNVLYENSEKREIYAG